MSRNELVKKAYSFFKDASSSGKVFTLEDVAKYAEWKKNTAKTYYSKLWSDFLVRVDNGYKATDFNYTEDQFIQLHNQYKTKRS